MAQTKKYFLSYKFTGVNINDLHSQIDPVVKIFDQAKNSKIFCNLYWDDFYVANKFTTKQIMEHCFDNLKQSDIYLGYVSDFFGGGMAIECGYALCSGLKIVTCIPNNSENYTSLVGVSDHVIKYEEQNDLCKKLAEFVILND